MGFSEQQLITWSNQGATVSSSTTYNSIKTCIDGVSWNNEVSYSIYLQGSYKNSTNIRANSDVDVVIEFQSTFYSNKNELSEIQLKEFDEYYPTAKYGLDDYKIVIIEELESYYSQNQVSIGDKAIKVIGSNGRLDADVVCCAQYREYNSFSKNNPTDYEEGIIFWGEHTKEIVINFPKLHYSNGAAKNQRCNYNFKPTTRVVKNIKAKMLELGIINEDLAASYFVENLLYNVPDRIFLKSYFRERIIGIIDYLNSLSDSDLADSICQHHQRELFGTSDQQWNITDCKVFVRELTNFWNNGRV